MGIRDEIEGHVRIKRPVLSSGTSYSWLNGEMEDEIKGCVGVKENRNAATDARSFAGDSDQESVSACDGFRMVRA